MVADATSGWNERRTQIMPSVENITCEYWVVHSSLCYLPCLSFSFDARVAMDFLNKYCWNKYDVEIELYGGWRIRKKRTKRKKRYKRIAAISHNPNGPHLLHLLGDLPRHINYSTGFCLLFMVLGKRKERKLADSKRPRIKVWSNCHPFGFCRNELKSNKYRKWRITICVLAAYV